MRNTTYRRRRAASRESMRPEYDFTGARRGATVRRYTRGTNVVVIDPDVLDVFPDSAAVNEVLRALAIVIRQRRRPRAKRRTA